MPRSQSVTHNKPFRINPLESTSRGVAARRLLTGLLFLVIPAATQAQVSFFTPPTYAGYGNIFVADFNGDGKPDLLSADGNLQLGNGDGTFSPGTPLPGYPLSPGVLAVADFNGDGKPDVLEQGTGRLLVLLGNGDGTFQAPSTTVIGITLFPVAAVDLNGDEKADVVGISGTNNLLVYISNGDGTFAPGVSYNLNLGAYFNPALTFGDFNGDGKLDVAVITTGDNVPGQVMVFLGNGDGTLQIPTISAGVVYPNPAVTADFNGDGRLDIAIASGPSATSQVVSLLLGKGDGTFQAPKTAVSSSGFLAAADLNGDGKPDLVLGSSLLEVWLGNGDGTFSNSNAGNYQLSVFQGAGGGVPVVADFNLDGKQDLAVGGYVLLGNGDGTLKAWQAVPVGVSAAVTGAFHKKGTQDVAGISSNSPNTLYILTNDDKGILSLAHTYTLQEPGSAIATGDFNGDGNLDLLVVGIDQTTNQWGYSVLLGKGGGSFRPPVFYPQNVVACGNSCSIIVADFNNDHKLDVAIDLNANESLAVLLGNGDGTFASPAYYFDAGNNSIVSADFNRDGKLDLASCGGVGLAILLGNGDGTFKPATFPEPGCGGLSTGDLNLDGKADLITNSDGGVQGYLGKGDGTFNTLPVWGLGYGRDDYPWPTSIRTLADINGDGIPDVVGFEAVGSHGVALSAYLGNGDGTFGLPCCGYILLFEYVGPSLEVTDMNADGKPDLIVSYYNSTFVMLNTTIPIPGTSFSPSPATFPSQAVGTSSGPVPVTLTNTGGVALTVTGVSINGAEANQFSQTNNCTSVPPLETCTIQVTFTPTSVGNAVANLSVTDNATGSPQQVPLSGVGTNGSGQEIGLSIPSGGSGSQTVQAGAMATYTLSIGGNGWSGQVSLSCTGAPPGASCSFPGGATMNVSGSSATQFKVTVSTMARTRSALIPSGHVPAPWLWAMLAVGLVVIPGSVKAKHVGLQRTGMLTLLLLLLCSCGGGGSSGSSNGTPAGSYPLTVTASAGSINQSVPLTLRVQ